MTSFYPYLQGVNPDSTIVGVDATKYIESLDIDHADYNSNVLIDKERPFFFLMLNFFQFLTRMNTENTVKFFPVVLIPLVVFSTYFFSLKMSNKRVAGWASFFMATGPTVVAGMYSYFLSKILGLTFILISIGLLKSAQI